MSRQLIVNADDYGYTPGVSSGIRDAHLTGVVSTTSAMMNSPYVVEELRAAQKICPNLAIGVHLVLTVGKPAGPMKKDSSLIDEHGNFLRFDTAFGWEKKEAYQWLSDIDVLEVQKEWEFQIEMLLKMGLSLDHLNSHHNITYLDNRLFTLMLELAHKYKVPIRHPPTLDFDKSIKDLITDLSIGYPNNMYHHLMKESSVSFVTNILHSLSEGITELITHPAYIDDELRKTSTYVDNRANELKTIIDPEIRQRISDENIELTTFSKAFSE